LENITQTRHKSASVENDLKHVNQSSASARTSAEPKSDSMAFKSQELHQKIETLHSRIDELNKKSDVLVAEVALSSTEGSGSGEFCEESSQINNENVETVGGVEESDEVRRRRLQHFSTASN
jgi:hypothetical protein